MEKEASQLPISTFLVGILFSFYRIVVSCLRGSDLPSVQSFTSVSVNLIMGWLSRKPGNTPLCFSVHLLTIMSS
jgi:hypothetical protein